MAYYKVISGATSLITAEQVLDDVWTSLAVELEVAGSSGGPSDITCLGSIDGGQNYPFDFGHSLDLGLTGNGVVAALETGVLVNAVKVTMSDIGTSASVTVYVTGK